MSTMLKRLEKRVILLVLALLERANVNHLQKSKGASFTFLSRIKRRAAAHVILHFQKKTRRNRAKIMASIAKLRPYLVDNNS